MNDSIGKSTEARNRSVSPLRLVLLVVWAVAVAGLGGYGSGIAIAKFGTLGAASLWLVGEAAGFVGKRLVIEKDRVAGVVLVAACVGAFVIVLCDRG
ncbi:MAG: hypothetical protein HYV60_15285 [Planctomycetia bacterium]|nr:hypothetical protein [Planctomycetia bacterium]